MFNIKEFYQAVKRTYELNQDIYSSALVTKVLELVTELYEIDFYATLPHNVVVEQAKVEECFESQYDF